VNHLVKDKTQDIYKAYIELHSNEPEGIKHKKYEIHGIADTEGNRKKNPSLNRITSFKHGLAYHVKNTDDFLLVLKGGVHPFFLKLNEINQFDTDTLLGLFILSLKKKSLRLNTYKNFIDSVLTDKKTSFIIPERIRKKIKKMLTKINLEIEKEEKKKE